MPVDMDDFSRILASDESTLPDLPITTEKKNGGAPATGDAEDGWMDDPISTKLEKIRAVFLNAKSPMEVFAQASVMRIGDWLEMVVKLSPKDIKVTGGIAFRHMMADMGPIDKDQYRPKTITCEYEEVAE